jgi:hypothetical protein
MAEYAVTDPGDHTVVFSVATATDAEVDDTVARADTAYRTWRRIAITAIRPRLGRRCYELGDQRDEGFPHGPSAASRPGVQKIPLAVAGHRTGGWSRRRMGSDRPACLRRTQRSNFKNKDRVHRS